MPAFDSVLFDFDGVLLDTEPVHCACWAEVLAPLGVELTWEFYSTSCIGIDDREMLRMMATESNPARDWRDLWAHYPAKKELFRRRMEANPPFDPALPEALAALKPKFKLAVVSSSSCAEIEPLLVRGGIRGLFATVVGGESVKRHKPEPEPYLLAAERLGAKAPLVLEDSEAGLASGRAAGFQVLAVKHPREVPAILRGLSGMI
jgi:HAD superfamily hydrolase (TIGR01509 family)